MASIMIISHFGPIKEARVTFNRFTVFVGPQGSGKSTIAKLYSLFLWLEKCLIRGTLTTKYVEQYSRFRKVYCGYHRLSSYFYDDTMIMFIGNSYRFVYSNSKLEIYYNPETPNTPTDVVKVMYVPAERNFLSSLENLSGLKSLPPSLLTFKDEYVDACKAYSSGFSVPIDDVSFDYDRLNEVAWLSGKGFRIRLSDASSGFQAVLPLLLVTRYLTSLVSSRHEDRPSPLNDAERERLKKEVKTIIENPDLTSEVRSAALAALSIKFTYSSFVNIVEEPEENLYPDSQKSVVFSLLGNANFEDGNQLVLTTHSPYIINYLTLAIKGGELRKHADGDKAILNSLGEIVPLESCIAAEDTSIYELSDGNARLLSMPYGLPADSNFLNLALGDTNNTFDRLLDIEEEINGR